MNDRPEPDSRTPASVSVVGPGDGEVLVLGKTRMRILEDGSTTEARLGIAESVVAPHSPGPPQHRHARHDEGFYVVSGTLRFTVGEQQHDVSAGTLVMVPPGAPHTFANVSDEPAVMISTFTPDLYVQYFRDMHDAMADGRTFTQDDNIRIMRNYATEPATEFPAH
ncbi:cupin domain-containing protein [Amycolatopsis jejuensis]|uniref:cupin domain-containing protein n=1 Tax=Amycolatopsis jejuensis TaxID=330084 RepID=UPI00052444BB|nr:cupin domain-containing protein [Amycolatopsis jejuensis]